MLNLLNYCVNEVSLYFIVMLNEVKHLGENRRDLIEMLHFVQHDMVFLRFKEYKRTLFTKYLSNAPPGSTGSYLGAFHIGRAK